MTEENPEKKKTPRSKSILEQLRPLIDKIKKSNVPLQWNEIGPEKPSEKETPALFQC